MMMTIIILVMLMYCNVARVRVDALVPHPHLRYIEWKGVKIYDFQKVTFSTLFNLYIAGLGVLIPKRYHMLG